MSDALFELRQFVFVTPFWWVPIVFFLIGLYAAALGVGRRW